MGTIPVYTKGIIRERAVPNLYDPTAVQRAATQFDPVIKTLDTGAQIAKKIQEADDTTRFNEAIIENKRAKMDLIEQSKQERMSNPEGFAKDFEKQLNDLDNKMGQDLPSRVRGQFKQSTSQVNLGLYDKNLGWENTRKIDMQAERIEKTAVDLSALAFRAGREGRGIEEINKDVDATLVAASTVVSPEVLSGMRRKMKQDVAETWINGIIDRNPYSARKILETKKYDKQLGDKLDDTYNRVDRVIARVKKTNKVNSLLGANSLIPAVHTMTPDQVESELDNLGVSSAIRGFYKDLTSLSTTKRKLFQPEKEAIKANAYKTISKVLSQDNISTNDLSAMQDAIYVGMTKQAISKNEGYSMLNELITPMLESKKKNLENYEAGDWNPFRDNIGIQELEKNIDKITGRQFLLDRMGKDAQGKQKKIPAEQEFAFNKQENIAYTSFLQSITRQANELKRKKGKDFNITKIEELPYVEQSQIYKTALNEVSMVMNNRNYADVPSNVNMVVTPVPELKFNTIAEAEKYARDEGIPDNTDILVGGRTATWNN